MAGGYTYDTNPGVVIPEPLSDTQDAPVSELSPCGKSTMKEFLALQEQNVVLEQPNLLT
jgi:hypothetical protein